jgi:WD40 repeat protein
MVACGSAVVAGSADCNISVLDINCDSLSLRRTLFGHAQAVASVAVCWHSRLMFSAALDGCVRGWSLPAFDSVKM